MTNKLLLGDCSEELKNGELYRRLCGKHICVLLISVDKFHGREESELLSLSGEIIRQISKSSLQNSFESYHAARTPGLSASIIALDAPDEREKLLEALPMLQAMLLRVLGRSVSISASSLYANPEQIADSYREAQGMLRLRLVRGEGCIFSQPLDADGMDVFVYPKVILEKIRQAIEREDCRMFEETLRELAETVKGQGVGVDNIYLIYYQIVNHIIELILSRHMQPSALFINEADLYRRVSGFENIYAMNEWFAGLFKSTLDGFKSERSKKETLMGAFTQYVQENYSSPLYPDDVAGQLGISYSYLRKLLQTELGLSFLDYVNQVRIGHARRLLTQTSKNIEQIAQSVGYSNRQSFVRAFKKQINQTPGSFRQAHGNRKCLPKNDTEDAEMII
jgi:YesN/AraC family two-component response regulator